MATPPPELPSHFTSVWKRGYDAGLRKAKMGPPYPPSGRSNIETLRTHWLAGYVAGLEYREAHGIRLQPRKWPTDDYFWDQVDVGRSNECWPWRSAIHKTGYGAKQPHRTAYELLNGQLEPGYHVHHTCGNKACCNPCHLESLLAADHFALTAAERIRSRTHCPQCHPYSGENLYVAKTGERHCRTCDKERHREKRDWKGGLPFGQRTHCPQGHPYSGENLYVAPNGDRMCRTCRREKDREAKREARAAARASHLANG